MLVGLRQPQLWLHGGYFRLAGQEGDNSAEEHNKLNTCRYVMLVRDAFGWTGCVHVPTTHSSAPPSSV